MKDDINGKNAENYKERQERKKGNPKMMTWEMTFNLKLPGVGLVDCLSVHSQPVSHLGFEDKKKYHQRWR